MSFPKYLEYSDTNEHWLGPIPSAWKLRRLGYFFSERREKVSDREFPPLSVTKDGIVPQLDTAAKTDDNDNRKRVCRGDFVINSRSDRKGSSGISDLDGSVSLINTVLVPSAEIVSRYAHYLLRSVPFQEEYYRFGKGIVADLWSTNYSEMRNILIPCPEPFEQQAIADFLDRETAKIDALVAEQRRLIELLKEKRQAVISHAVTKGLDPNAKMKPSGIEWLGDVPEHWESVNIRNLIRTEALTIQDGNHGELHPKAADFTSSGIPFLMAADMSDGKVDLENCHFITERMASQLRIAPSLPGDVLLSHKGQLGEVAVIPEQIPFPYVVLTPQITYYRVHGTSLDRQFLFYSLLSKLVQDHLLFLASVQATRPYVGLIAQRELVLALPPLSEQRSVSIELNQSTAEVNALISEAERTNCLLLERRTALISAAVTGKIDVRHLASQEAA